MNVRQVIDHLTATASRLPQGLDTELEVAMCDEDSIQLSAAVEVAFLRSPSRVWVILKGHPHLDEEHGRVTRMAAVASHADEQLREWTGGEGSSDS